MTREGKNDQAPSSNDGKTMRKAEARTTRRQERSLKAEARKERQEVGTMTIGLWKKNATSPAARTFSPLSSRGARGRDSKPSPLPLPVGEGRQVGCIVFHKMNTRARGASPSSRRAAVCPPGGALGAPGRTARKCVPDRASNESKGFHHLTVIRQLRYSHETVMRQYLGMSGYPNTLSGKEMRQNCPSRAGLFGCAGKERPAGRRGQRRKGPGRLGDYVPIVSS